jgi:hypothetical protein
MNKILKVLVVLPAILFVVIGLRWLVAPAGVAPMFGLTLAEGVGLSSQVGDMSAFFLTGGICMLIAVISGRRSWYYPPLMLLSLTAIGRILAWLVHDAALAVDLIAPEIIVSVILLVASRRLPESD